MCVIKFFAMMAVHHMLSLQRDMQNYDFVLYS